MAPVPPPHRPILPTAARPQVIQGAFFGNRPQLQARHHQAGTVQLATRGTATQLPPSLVDFRPRGAGQRLPEPVQRKMEAFFKADFSEVRIHVGNEAPSIGALAFTHGPDIYFAHGQYDPMSPHGQRLLGHELTHVVQQRAGRVRNPFGSGIAVVQDPGLEAEAERMGMRAATAPIQAKPSPEVSRPPAAHSVVQPLWVASEPWKDGFNKYKWEALPHNRGHHSAPAGWYTSWELNKFKALDEKEQETDEWYDYYPGSDRLSKVFRTSRRQTYKREEFDIKGLYKGGGSINITSYGLLSIDQIAAVYDKSSRKAKVVFPRSSTQSVKIPREEFVEGLPEYLEVGSEKLYPHTYDRAARYTVYSRKEYTLSEQLNPQGPKTTKTNHQITAYSKNRTYRVDKENVDIWGMATHRSQSQEQVMGTSAREEAEAAGYKAGKREWHWCHLIAHSMGDHANPQTPENLVAGTAQCNGAMIHLEQCSKAYIKATGRSLIINVTALLVHGTHLAETIIYKVQDIQGGTYHANFKATSSTKSHIINTSVLAKGLFEKLSPSDYYKGNENFIAFRKHVEQLGRGEVESPSPIASRTGSNRNESVSPFRIFTTSEARDSAIRGVPKTPYSTPVRKSTREKRSTDRYKPPGRK